MELRPAEKLILVMLAEIQEHLKIRGEIDTKLLKAAIFDGHNWALDWEMPGITQVEPVSTRVRDDVVNILDMHDMMELSFDDLDADAKAAIDEWKVRFRGFDGNNETEYMSTAQFLVKEMGRFSNFAERDFNSHSPTVARALRMYAVYEPLRAGTAMRSGVPRLTAEELKSITDAA